MKKSGFVDSRFIVGSDDLAITFYSVKDKEGCNRGHGLSTVISGVLHSGVTEQSLFVEKTKLHNLLPS